MIKACALTHALSWYSRIRCTPASPASEPHRPHRPRLICDLSLATLITPIPSAAKQLIVLVLDCVERWHERLLVHCTHHEVREYSNSESMFGSAKLPAREKICSTLASCARWQAVCLNRMMWSGNRSRSAQTISNSLSRSMKPVGSNRHRGAEAAGAPSRRSRRSGWRRTEPICGPARVTFFGSWRSARLTFGLGLVVPFVVLLLWLVAPLRHPR